MPIFEYICRECEKEFEKLAYGSDPDVACPECGSRKVKKKLSTFGMSGVEKQTSSGCTSCTKSTCSSCS